MNIFITGVTGFIGSHLAKHLKSKGFAVYGCGTKQELREDLKPVLSGYNCMSLNGDFDAGVFKNIDVVVHGAYSQHRKNIKTINIEGAKKWHRAAAEMGVKTQVFLTSYSAKAGSKSAYAAIKYELEDFFLEEKQPVIRPGLVLGDGGLYQRMGSMLKRLPAVPLLDGGKYEVPIIRVEDLCPIVEKVLNNPESRVYPAYEEEPVTMKALLQKLKQDLNTKCLFVPVPSIIPLIFLKTLEALRIPFPVKSDSIIALRSGYKG